MAKQKYKGIAALMFSASVLCSSALHAATVNLSFDTVAQSNASPSNVMSGTWATLQIVDTTPGTVSLTVNTFLPANTSTTLTGIWLSVPSAVTAGLTSVSLTTGTGTGQNPFSFTAGSTFSTTQTTVPSGSTGAVAGKYNLYLKFPNSAPGFQGTETETFSLTGSGGAGLSAASFSALAAQTAGGLPNPDFYAMASFTNAGGTGGSGIAYVGAVPLPASAWLFGSGLFGLAGSARRKSQAA